MKNTADASQIIPTANMSAEDARAWLEYRRDTGCMGETEGYAIEAVLAYIRRLELAVDCLLED